VADSDATPSLAASLGEPSAKALDRRDLALLVLLQRDGRLTNKALAEALGMSQSACHDRMKRLQSKGLIRGFHADIALERIAEPVRVTALISLVSLTADIRRRFEERLRDTPDVVEAQELSGKIDYAVRFVCPSLGRYQSLTDDWLNDDGLRVNTIESLIALRSVVPPRGPAIERLIGGEDA